MFLGQNFRWRVSLRRILATYLNHCQSTGCCQSCSPRAAFQARTHALTVECPCHPETVRADLVKKTRGGFTVEIGLVGVGHNAEFGKVEISIQALQRIESPGDSIDGLLQNCFALRQFEFLADSKISIRSEEH